MTAETGADRALRWGAAAGGPLLIVASVLVVLHPFWIDPRLTTQQVDLLAFWMPRWCHLGQALASGDIPTWLPHQFGGVPFASDPQSGWLYAPAMLLFPVASCARAIGLAIVSLPIVGGLGLYLFLRKEGLGRPAATVGGLTLSLTVTGSAVALSMPFSGFLAWTSLALAGAAGALRARSLASLAGWVGLTGFAWSQLAGAHLSHGLLMGSGVLFVYVVARSVAVRAGDAGVRSTILRAAGLILALPLLSAAVLVPRIALLPRTSIGKGYGELARLATELSGTYNAPPFANEGVGPWWGTSFARGPGGFVGPLAILLIPWAFTDRRWRLPAIGLSAAGAVAYLLTLDIVVGFEPLRRLALSVGLGEIWLRSPFRFRYVLVLVFAVLAAFGLQAWLDRGVRDGRELRNRLLWFLGPIVVFAVLPMLAGAPVSMYVPLAIGVAYSVPLLAFLARGVRWAGVALPVALAASLTVSGLVAQAGEGPPERLGMVGGDGLGHSFSEFRRPWIDPSDYLTLGPIGLAVHEGEDGEGVGRYFTHVPTIARDTIRGFLFHQGPTNWPAYENGRSILFDIEEIQGYSPVQLDRYWRLVRRVDPTPILYNSASFQVFEPSLVRLFGVRWVVARDRRQPPAGTVEVAREGNYTAYAVTEPDERASVVAQWEVTDERTALERIVDRSFEPSEVAILEADPGIAQPAAPVGASVSYREEAPWDVTVTTASPEVGVLVVRNAWDRGWHATVDGETAPVMVADYLMQGVVVPPGTHEVRLTYRDPAIGVGLLVSALAWLALSGVAAAGWWLARRREARGSPRES